jgi:hypothetical protein
MPPFTVGRKRRGGTWNQGAATVEATEGGESTAQKVGGLQSHDKLMFQVIMAIDQELVDHLFADYNYQKPEDLIGENGLLKQLTKAIVERVLQADRLST